MIKFWVTRSTVSWPTCAIFGEQVSQETFHARRFAAEGQKAGGEALILLKRLIGMLEEKTVNLLAAPLSRERS